MKHPHVIDQETARAAREWGEDMELFAEFELPVLIRELALPADKLLEVAHLISAYGQSSYFTDTFKHLNFEHEGRFYSARYSMRGYTPVEVLWVLYNTIGQRPGCAKRTRKAIRNYLVTGDDGDLKDPFGDVARYLKEHEFDEQ